MKLITLFRIPATDPTKEAYVYTRLSTEENVLVQMKNIVRDVIENELGQDVDKKDEIGKLLKPLYDAGTETEFYSLTPIGFGKSEYSDRLNNAGSDLVFFEGQETSYEFHYYIDVTDISFESTNIVDIFSH